MARQKTNVLIKDIIGHKKANSDLLSTYQVDQVQRCGILPCHSSASPLNRAQYFDL